MMNDQISPERNRLEERSARWLQVKGRLRPGVSLKQAQSDLSVVMERLSRAYPDTNENRGVVAVDFMSATIHPDVNRSIRQMASILRVAALALLLVACANVVQLFLVRSDYRRKELGIRISVGASRGRILTQLITEAFLVALASGALGLVGSQLLLSCLKRVIPTLPLPVAMNFGLTSSTCFSAIFLAAVAGLLSGLLPAIRASRISPASLNKGFLAAADHSGFRLKLQSVLIALQIGLSVVLLLVSSLFVRSLFEMRKLPLGFSERRLVIVTFDASLRGHRNVPVPDFLKLVTDRLAAVPGVRSAAITDCMPLGLVGLLSVQNAPVLLPGQPAPDKRNVRRVDYATVSPDYFQTVGINVVAGRDFGLLDRGSTSQLAIVNEAMARKCWPDGTVLGRTFSISGPQGPYAQGVVANSRYRTLGEDQQPFFYLSLLQNQRSYVEVVARTVGDPSAILLAMRRELHNIDPDLPITEAKTLDQHLRPLTYLPTAASVLFASLGVIAALMAAISTYGLLAFFVDRHRREIGIRMALGAKSNDIWAMVPGEVRGAVISGLVVGLAVAIGATRALSGLLYGIGHMPATRFRRLAPGPCAKHQRGVMPQDCPALDAGGESRRLSHGA